MLLSDLQWCYCTISNCLSVMRHRSCDVDEFNQGHVNFCGDSLRCVCTGRKTYNHTRWRWAQRTRAIGMFFPCLLNFFDERPTLRCVKTTATTMTRQLRTHHHMDTSTHVHDNFHHWHYVCTSHEFDHKHWQQTSFTASTMIIKQQSVSFFSFFFSYPLLIFTIRLMRMELLRERVWVWGDRLYLTVHPIELWKCFVVLLMLNVGRLSPGNSRPPLRTKNNEGGLETHQICMSDALACDGWTFKLNIESPNSCSTRSTVTVWPLEYLEYLKRSKQRCV